jgi:branched-chain amino acid aminotransferase
MNDTPAQIYVRMAHISTDDQLGVKSPKKTKLYAILNPTTLKKKQLKVKCAADVFKNWPLGHGSFRVSGNFGPLVPSMVDARNNGFDDVLWLIDDYIKEMTVLNVFMLWKNRFGKIELVTPPNDGCVYNGTIRQSVIEMAGDIKKEKGINVVEKQISIHELISAHHEDRLLEFFGASTSSSIQSISRIGYRDQLVDISDKDPEFT